MNNTVKKSDIQTYLNRVSNKIKALRMNRGWTQEHLGYLSGTSQSTIRGLESGGKSPSLSTIYKVAQALDIEPHELVDVTQFSYEQ